MSENTIKKDYMGMISWGNQTCNRTLPMFGSEIGTDRPVVLRISRASMTRELSQNYYNCESKPLIEIEMTPMQWAEFLTAGNTTGVPCTIHKFNGETMSPVDRTNIVSPFIKESEECFNDFKKGATELESYINSVLQSGKSMNKTQMKELLDKISSYKNRTVSSVQFVHDQFNEAMETSVTRAKSEIAAYANRVLNGTGCSCTIGHDETPLQIDISKGDN